MAYLLRTLDVLNVILGNFVKKDARIALSVFKWGFYELLLVSGHSGVPLDMS